MLPRGDRRQAGRGPCTPPPHPGNNSAGTSALRTRSSPGAGSLGAQPEREALGGRPEEQGGQGRAEGRPNQHPLADPGSSAASHPHSRPRVGLLGARHSSWAAQGWGWRHFPAKSAPLLTEGSSVGAGVGLRARDHARLRPTRVGSGWKGVDPFTWERAVLPETRG